MMNGKMVQESENSLKKRKWDDEDKISEKQEKVKIVKPILDTFAQHETPLPLEWQRCLDIKVSYARHQLSSVHQVNILNYVNQSLTMVLQYVDLFIFLFFDSSFFQNSRTSFFISYTWKESFK